MHLPLLFFTLVTFGLCIGTELCKEKEWYDDLSGKCRRCITCVDKSWEVAPCTAFMNTMCVDLAEISRSLENSIRAGEKAMNNGHDISSGPSNKQRWHEMEGSDVKEPHHEQSVKEVSITSSGLFDDHFDQWRMVTVTAAAMLFLFFVCLIIMCTVRHYGPIQIDPTKMTRSRLFSRDRLNTTEYMKNLANLDRRLAIDEILEKKKRAAIFEPQFLKENLYSDEVFVDISGLPRNLRDSHDYEEIDNKKCLLEMQDRQQE